MQHRKVGKFTFVCPSFDRINSANNKIPAAVPVAPLVEDLIPEVKKVKA